MRKALTALVAITLTTCASKLPPAPLDMSAQGSAVRGNTAFALDLYNTLTRDRADENILISPASITTAFGLLYPGAANETAKELETVLGFDLPRDEQTAALSRLARDLEIDEDGRRLAINNAIWVDDQTVLEAPYLDIVKTQYDAAELRVDFRKAWDAARQEINRWVAQKTEDRIKDLLPEPLVTEETRSILVNTIYMDADWQRPFTAEATREDDFTLLDSKKAKIDMMRQLGYFQYTQSGGVEALRLPYQGDDLSMIILLPKRKNGLADAKADFLSDPSTLNALLFQLDQSESVEVDLKLPKLNVKDKVFLKDTLEGLGLENTFSNGADFSAMVMPEKQIDRAGLKIGEVVHQTFLEVDEKGTEAAAATAIVTVKITSARSGPEPPPPVPFYVDHPFIMLVRHEPTGMILFLGQITDPR